MTSARLATIKTITLIGAGGINSDLENNYLNAYQAGPVSISYGQN
jgi:hypothetical protein